MGESIVCEIDILCFFPAQLCPEHKVFICQQYLDMRRVFAVVCASLVTISSDYMVPEDSEVTVSYLYGD